MLEFNFEKMIAQCFIRERMYVHYTMQSEWNAILSARPLERLLSLFLAEDKLSKRGQARVHIAFCSDFPDNAHLNNPRRFLSQSDSRIEIP